MNQHGTGCVCNDHVDPVSVFKSPVGEADTNIQDCLRRGRKLCFKAEPGSYGPAANPGNL